MSIELRVKYSTKVDWRTDEQFTISPSYSKLDEDGRVYIIKTEDDTTTEACSSQSLIEKGKSYKILFSVDDWGETNEIFYLRVGQNSSAFAQNETGNYEFISENVEDVRFEFATSSIWSGKIYNLQIEEIGWRTLDVIEEDILLTKELQDIRQFNDKSGEYSKDFRLPDTKENDDFFKDFFEISTYNGFNPNKKIECVVYSDDIQMIAGFMVLNSIDVEGHQHYYNCNIYGGGLIFFNELKTLKLYDLDYDDMTHEFRAEVIRNTWYPTGKEAQSSGKTFAYPIVDYGNAITAQYLQYGNVAEGATEAPGGMPVEDFRPVVYMKTYFDKIHEEQGYTYDGDFVESDEFLNMAMTVDNWKTDNSGGEFTMYGDMSGIDNSESGQDILVISTIEEFKQSTITNARGIRVRNEVVEPMWMGQNFNTVGSEPVDNIYQPSYEPRLRTFAGKYKPDTAVYSKFEGNIVGEFKDLVLTTWPGAGKPKLLAFSSPPMTLVMSVGVYRNATLVETVAVEHILERDTTSVVKWETLAEHLCLPTDEITFSYTFTCKNTDQLFCQKFNATVTNVGLIRHTLTPGQEVVFNPIVPDMYQIDLVKSIITAHNLFPVVDSQLKNVTYNTYEQFYADGIDVDWTEKLDRSQPIQFLLGNEYTTNMISLAHQEGENYWSKKHGDRYKDRVMGDREIFTGNEFETDTYEIETEFGAYVFDQPQDRLFVSRLTAIEPVDPLTDDEQKVEMKLPNTPSIGFFQTLQSAATWNFVDEYGSIEEETQGPSFTPWLDVLNTTPDTNILLNFNHQPEIWNEVTRPLKNLYTIYWRRYLDNFLNKDARILVGYFDLDERDYGALKLNETVHIDGTLYIINKVADFQNGELTECELIKSIYNNNIYVDGNIIVDNLNDGWKITDPIIDPEVPTTTTTGLIDGGEDVVYMQFNSPGLIDGGENDDATNKQIDAGDDVV